jgi:arsenite methyltransferase
VTVTQTTDKWHRWLTDVRHGGDDSYLEQIAASTLYPLRDRVLAGADPRPGETLLDVGTGDGLIAFGALDRVGQEGRVIFSDVSADLLEHCRARAGAAGQDGRCEFVLASADRLTGVPDASVDVVTTRSVLIYVADKAAAFGEFARVLRPGGRISLFEPINRLMSSCGPGVFTGYDVRPVAEIAAKLSRRLDEIQPPDTDPMLDFDERDLVALAERAGFTEISLELQVTVKPWRTPVRWDVFLRASGNPLVPPLGDIMDQVLTDAEAEAFSSYLSPLVEAGAGTTRLAVSYLKAARP